MSRRAVSELELVDQGEVVVRLVADRDFDVSAPPGQRMKPAALQTNDFTPSDTSYGASVYVASRLGNVDLRERLNKRTHVEARVQVAALAEIGLRVVYSPEDCDIDELKAAHASLIGVTRNNRVRVLRLLDMALP